MIATLPDGKRLELPERATPLDAAAQIGPRLAKDAVGARVNGQLADLLTPIPDGASIEILTTRKPADWLDLARHTLAHVMAQAVLEHYEARGFGRERVRMGVGPVIENGFYYDFDLPEPLGAEELPRVEERMRAILARDLPLERFEVTRDQALASYRGRDRFKTELIEGLPEGETISFYRQGSESDFTDLCRGPHVPRTGLIPPHFRLTSTSGAYWRGSEKNPMLQRVYGVAFATAEELETYLGRIEEARKRDHRKLGRELELFLIDPLVGKGLPMWLPKGTVVRETLVAFLREQQLERGYQGVVTPNIGNVELYRTSGHYPYYADSQFPPITVDDEQYMLKPMNCPHHVRIYAHKPRSYRDLPVRLAEFGTVYRYEQSGELNGLTRVRGFTQDDAHIFCRPDQLKAEFLGVLDLTVLVLRTFGLNDVRFRVGTREPGVDKYVGDAASWDLAERQIVEAVEEVGLPFTVEPGDAAFYGPKLDFVVKDVIGREWQLGTIQVDYNLPERFELEYAGEDGQQHRPVMIHRAPFGSLERFFGILIEHFGGNFPVWLAPVQARLVPISDRHAEYAREVEARLRAAGLRVEVDDSSERMQAKIRDAELQKVPYILVVGDKEVAAGAAGVREHGKGDRGQVSVDALVAELRERVTSRT